jgi:PIN domain nuclease of toxin-antitoxin system
MRLLLDTHIWLWSEADTARLSKRVQKVLSAPDNEFWLSPISTWEILALCEKNRLKLKPDPQEWIANSLAGALFHEAPLTHEVVLAMKHVALRHRDPADWFLAATARNFDLTLVTSDENLIRGRGYSVLTNS